MIKTDSTRRHDKLRLYSVNMLENEILKLTRPVKIQPLLKPLKFFAILVLDGLVVPLTMLRHLHFSRIHSSSCDSVLTALESMRDEMVSIHVMFMDA